MTAYAVIEAPSVLGLFPGGVERLPEALLRAGLAEALDARHAGRVAPPPYDPERDPATGLLNPIGLRTFAGYLADATGAVLDRGEVPVVLGVTAPSCSARSWLSGGAAGGPASCSSSTR